ncbi:reverse transcriptase domain-containing protein [Nephila pilipes]|uniref:Reverse transcriptase domain-containing protein n=1 Tax=Nephila pilipes TaxID=299642 RepID=A0A8X6Q5W3_NEPPI|nr:reverse transcriptase domain-containing protein [Nephila pilipes]
MLNSFLYVDDLGYGANTAQEADELLYGNKGSKTDDISFKEIKNYLELYKLCINNIFDENTNCVKEISFLGMKGDPIEDKIKIDFKGVRESVDARVMKCHVMRAISNIFYAFDIVSLFVITVKILLREMWERCLMWDEELTFYLEKKRFSELEFISIERKYFESAEVKEISSYVFY